MAVSSFYKIFKGRLADEGGQQRGIALKGAGKGNRIQPVGQQKIFRQQAVDLAAGKGVVAGFAQQAAHLPFDVGEDVAGRLLRLHRKNRKIKWL